MMQSREYIDHEVRVQILEKAIIDMKDEFRDIREEFKSINNNMIDLMKQNFNYFLTTIGIILALFGGMIVTKIFS